MGLFIFILIVLVALVLLYFFLKHKNPPVTTTTTLPPVPTTTIAPELKCYNLNVPVEVLNNGTEDLCIDYKDFNNNYVIHPYYVFDDCGSYQPDGLCINICSFVEPTFMFGLHGEHVTVDSIIITVGDCLEGAIECN